METKPVKCANPRLYLSLSDQYVAATTEAQRAQILAALFTLVNDLSIVVAPLWASILMPINGLLWLVWWLLVSRGLFRLVANQ